MTGPESEDFVTEGWRRRVDDAGRRHLGREDMIRLGIIRSSEQLSVEAAEPDVAAYDLALDELAAIRRELKALDAETNAIQIVSGIMRQIRELRAVRARLEKGRADALSAADGGAPKREPTERHVSDPAFLGKRVSHRLRFEGGDATRLTARNLPELQSFGDIAGALNVSPAILQWLTYERGADTTDHYTRFAIPKRSGGRRLISTPKPAMRAAQQWVRLNVLAPLPVSPHAAAFRPGKSIVDNARLHSGKACVIRLDLSDFFATVSYARIRGFFESLGYNPGVSTVLALICTDAPRSRVTLDGQTQMVIVGERSLPQGACTSPDLANLITIGLDARIAGLARKFGYTYSRYADDLVLSAASEEIFAAGVVSAVSRVCVEEGFKVNRRKTRIMRSPNRQIVTGLLVNDQVRLSRADLRKIRAFLHRCETSGLDAVSAELGKDARAVAHGYFAYVYMVTPSAALKLLEKHPWI